MGDNNSNCLLTVFGYYLLIAIFVYPAILVYFNAIEITCWSFIGCFNLFLLTSSQLILIMAGWYVIHFSYHFYHRNDQLDVKRKAVLITGCNSGLGLTTAKRLDQLGFYVFATVLDVDGDGARQLRSDCSERIKIVKLDLRNDEEINNAVAQVVESGREFWALVNNAGVCLMSFTEFDSKTNINQMTFDVNYFGPYKLIQKCLPKLRKSKGRIVNITSVEAECNFGLTSTYCASKHALRALVNGLAAELTPFGVKMICIEPGSFQTNIVDRMNDNYQRCLNEADPIVVKDYEQVYQEMRNGFSSEKAIKLKDLCTSNDFAQLTSAVEKALVNRHPKMCYRVTGSGVMRLMWWLMTVVPVEINCWMSQGYFKSLFGMKND